MSYRPIIAYLAIVCFASLTVVNLSQPNWELTWPKSATECSFPASQNLLLGVCENQTNVGVNPPIMQPAIEGEFLPACIPIQTPFQTTSVRTVQPHFHPPVHAEATNFLQSSNYGRLVQSPPQYVHTQSAAPPIQVPQFQNATNYSPSRAVHPAMQVQNYNLFQYRRMMKNHPGANINEIQGSWRGINKGLATVAIDEQFVKHFRNVNGQTYGDNISVHQVPLNQVRQNGWQPEFDQSSGTIKRGGNFQVQQAKGVGSFRHGLILSYRDGGNPRRDPSRLIEDRLVKLDDNHMLGRATVRFGPFRIPLAYFVLERVQ